MLVPDAWTTLRVSLNIAARWASEERASAVLHAKIGNRLRLLA